MGLFDKKYCDVCSEKIGLLGNRKLEDGNLCKDCAKKLSPFFNERRHSTVADIKEQLTIRERLSPVLPYLSVSNLAKDYFGKSSSWFYQRLNGNSVHGKICKFTQEELAILDMALKDISRRITKLNLV